jgi:hypothetical protein
LRRIRSQWRAFFLCPSLSLSPSPSPFLFRFIFNTSNVGFKTHEQELIPCP